MIRNVAVAANVNASRNHSPTSAAMVRSQGHTPRTPPAGFLAQDYFAGFGDSPAVPNRLRPTMSRAASASSAIHMVMPGEPAERVAEVSAALGAAVQDARAEKASLFGKGGNFKHLGELFRRTRSKGEARLEQLGKVLAGPKCASFNKTQVQQICHALDRPATEATALVRRAEPRLANTAGMLAQPSVEPLLPFCDTLIRETQKLCDVLNVSDSDAATVLKLRRSAYALCFAIDALQTYDGYPLTPGYKEIPAYQAQLRQHDAKAQVRIRELDVKERTQR